MSEEQKTEEPTAETPEATEEPETETPETETPETAENTEKTYGGVVPLTDVSALLAADEWDDGGDARLSAESVAEKTRILAKDSVAVVKATDSLANRFRRMCTTLLLIRAGIIITRADGTVGPDWDGRSDLAKRYSTMVITKPLYDDGKADRVDYVQRTISAYYSKKVPGQNYSLRDGFIREWVKEHGSSISESGEVQDLTEAEVESRVDAEFASYDGKSDRVKKSERATDRANVGGPGQGPKVKNPIENLMGAANAVVTTPADLSLVVLTEQAHKLLSRIALQVRKNNGEIQDRPKVMESWGPLVALVDAITESIDGKRESWDSLYSALYGKDAREAWNAITEAETKEAAEATETVA